MHYSIYFSENHINLWIYLSYSNCGGVNLRSIVNLESWIHVTYIHLQKLFFLYQVPSVAMWPSFRFLTSDGVVVPNGDENLMDLSEALVGHSLHLRLHIPKVGVGNRMAMDGDVMLRRRPEASIDLTKEKGLRYLFILVMNIFQGRSSSWPHWF